MPQINKVSLQVRTSKINKECVIASILYSNLLLKKKVKQEVVLS